MKQVAIFMSDFHLGQNNRTEEFFADEEFSELLGRLSHEHAEDKVDLVLLGDVLDLWTAVTEPKEVSGDRIDDIDLYLPAECEEEKKIAVAEETKKVEAILQSHRVFFEALGRFLVRAPGKRRIVYVFGNHDHSLVDESLQICLKKAIVSDSIASLAQQFSSDGKSNRDSSHDSDRFTEKIKEELKQHIRFVPHYPCPLEGREPHSKKPHYEDSPLQVYAEHGNQFTYGGIFRYEDDNDNHKSTFDKFGSECPGYVHFKVITARVARAVPKLNSLLIGVFNPANWPSLAVWLLLRGYFRALIYMQRFQIQFQFYASETKNDLQPEQCVRPKNKCDRFEQCAQRGQCEQRERRVKRVQWSREQMPRAWKTILYMLKARLRSFSKDEFGDRIPKLFQKGTDPLSLPLCGHELDPGNVKTIILGHSHVAKDVDVPGLEGIKYYNTGSWTLRREKNREIIEQTWVVISTELPVTFISADKHTLFIKDESGEIRQHQLLDPEAADGLNEHDRIIVERNEGGHVWRIVREALTSPRIIDRQLVRRRIERAKVTNNPVTPDGTRLNPVLRSMNLRVGDLILFRRNYGPCLWRLTRSLSFGKLFAAVPGVITGLINRMGTSTYWNHIAMVFGASSEPREAEQYNDPLIIESVPGTGVGIHTPEHYLQYPKEWDFAVLRPTTPLLNSLKNRQLLRRITLNYIGAAYDKESVTRGTIQYAAFATNEKGRSALGGIVMGAWLGFVIFSFCAAVWITHWLYRTWPSRRDDWLEVIRCFTNLQCLTDYLNQWIHLREIYSSLPKETEDFMLWGGASLLLVLGIVLAGYLLWQLGRLFATMWVALTVLIGASLGFSIVPIMADMTEGWSQLSTKRRWAFATIWFSPLLVLLAPSDWFLVTIMGVTAKTWGEYFIIKLMLIVAAGLISVLFTWIVNALMACLIAWVAARRRNFKELIHKLYVILQWPITTPSRCSKYPLHKQFICSGLLQEALVETGRELLKKSSLVMPSFHPNHVEKVFTVGESSKDKEEHLSLEDVVVNPDWKEEWSLVEQSCVLRDTLPRHFALGEDKFKWMYLHLDQVLTHEPSNSCRAQAYTDPLNTSRGEPPSASVWAIQCGFTGLTLLWVFVNHSYLPQPFVDLPQTLLFGGAILFGTTAIYMARQARRTLACDPNRRGKALMIGGFVSGSLSLLLGMIGLR